MLPPDSSAAIFPCGQRGCFCLAVSASCASITLAVLPVLTSRGMSSGAGAHRARVLRLISTGLGFRRLAALVFRSLLADGLRLHGDSAFPDIHGGGDRRSNENGATEDGEGGNTKGCFHEEVMGI